MAEPQPKPLTREERDSALLFLDHLEGRRQELATAMWQAPGLTIAAQAFLLIVLTDESVDERASKWILVAGLAAVVAAICALLRLRQREVLYSDAVAYWLDLLGAEDPRPSELKRGGKLKSLPDQGFQIDRGFRWVAGLRFFSAIHLYWAIVLGLFGVADVIAYCTTS